MWLFCRNSLWPINWLQFLTIITWLLDIIQTWMCIMHSKLIIDVTGVCLQLFVSDIHLLNDNVFIVNIVYFISTQYGPAALCFLFCPQCYFRSHAWLCVKKKCFYAAYVPDGSHYIHLKCAIKSLWGVKEEEADCSVNSLHPFLPTLCTHIGTKSPITFSHILFLLLEPATLLNCR